MYRWTTQKHNASGDFVSGGIKRKFASDNHIVCHEANLWRTGDGKIQLKILSRHRTRANYSLPCWSFLDLIHLVKVSLQLWAVHDTYCQCRRCCTNHRCQGNQLAVVTESREQNPIHVLCLLQHQSIWKCNVLVKYMVYHVNQVPFWICKWCGGSKKVMPLMGKSDKVTSLHLKIKIQFQRLQITGPLGSLTYQVRSVEVGDFLSKSPTGDAKCSQFEHLNNILVCSAWPRDSIQT